MNILYRSPQMNKFQKIDTDERPVQEPVQPIDTPAADVVDARATVAFVDGRWTAVRNDGKPRVFCGYQPPTPD